MTIIFASITQWFQSMEPIESTYWTIAIASSAVFCIQMALTLLGVGETDGTMDFGGDGDADFHTGDTLDTGGAIQLFTIRNAVNFLLGIGWGGVCFYDTIPNIHLLAIVAILCGVALVAAFYFMFRGLMRLESNGSFHIQESVGQICDVYLRIPAHRGGQGRIQISFHGSVQELPAITDGEEISSGTKVRVLGVVGANTLLVEIAS